MSTPPSTMSSWLRAQPSLIGVAPVWDASLLPDSPLELFRDWIGAAVDAGVSEPHVATLATLDADGIPDARALILKDVDERGWAFAGPRASRKGDQLSAHPAAALSIWWQPLVRAVRVRGRVVEATMEESAADLAARSAAARAGLEPGDWVLWRLVPERIEFWQGSSDRRHIRVVYERDGGAWMRTDAGAAGS
ncbi:pyridoxamine 5'-phosphate oxidase family protein [Microbacterium sp. NPDC090003]|uniref:pyridoxamine 5'-phosphate oxidase family protein n=1 Tax=Microbacterium sp. NPDC090003 TaxID=3364203 RepID=UPI00382A9EE9